MTPEKTLGDEILKVHEGNREGVKMEEKIKDDGSCAFPFNRTHPECYPGMSLRDYFAGQALAGLSTRTNMTDMEIVLDAYKLADAMLQAREKKT